MALVTRLVHALLLLALLLAVASSPGEAKELCPEPCRCPGGGRLDCHHTDLATVPPASRRRALTVLDFTDNFIATIGEEDWKDYPWAETLLLKGNELQAVKSHSLEGLFLLKHLDLSANKILSIEEHAFEPLPFLKLLDLSGNGLTQIRSGTFQAWHGMQFLQELILSHNPLAVIADDAFFKLPSVSSLDLTATQVTPQTVLLFLETTEHLKTLQVPKAVACCLCQEHPQPESPCRTIQFFCKKLCSSSAPHCAHTALLAQTRREIMDSEQPKMLNTRTVLSLKPREPSLEDDGSVTLEVALTPSTEGHVSSLDNSRKNSYPPQHLLGHKSKASVDNLKAKIKKKLHKPKSIMNLKSFVQYQPPAGGLNPSDDVFVFGHQRVEEEGPGPRQNYMRTQKQHKNEDSKDWIRHNQLFYQVLRPVKVERKPRADQGLNKNLDFLSDPLVQRRPAVSSRVKPTAAEKHSSLGEPLLIIPDTTETHWKKQEEGSNFLNKPGSPQDPDLGLDPGELLESTHLLAPDKGLQTFMAHVEQALRTDCSLPQLKQACAHMVSKTRRLLKVLSERQETQGASDRMGQCPLQESMSIRMASGKGKKLTGKQKLEAIVYVITFVVLLSFFVFVFLILRCICHRCAQPHEVDYQPDQTRTSWLRRFIGNPQRRGKKAYKEPQERAGSPSQFCPSTHTIHGPSQCCSLFRKSELPWLLSLRNAYESQR